MEINYSYDVSSGGAGEAPSGSSESCDWCGRSVSRETAVRRVHGAEADAEAVPLCTDCEYGTD
jgi:hypothetical protein